MITRLTTIGGGALTTGARRHIWMSERTVLKGRGDPGEALDDDRWEPTPIAGRGAAGATCGGSTMRPGGWNRIIVQSERLERDVEALRKAGVHFRGDYIFGPGGRQILAEDPSGNLVELFEPKPDSK